MVGAVVVGSGQWPVVVVVRGSGSRTLFRESRTATSLRHLGNLDHLGNLRHLVEGQDDRRLRNLARAGGGARLHVILVFLVVLAI